MGPSASRRPKRVPIEMSPFQVCWERFFPPHNNQGCLAHNKLIQFCTWSSFSRSKMATCSLFVYYLQIMKSFWGQIQLFVWVEAQFSGLIGVQLEGYFRATGAKLLKEWAGNLLNNSRERSSLQLGWISTSLFGSLELKLVFATFATGRKFTATKAITIIIARQQLATRATLGAN